MIRGCIENISPRAVRGWIHADGRSLRDAPLLAFVGPECIGAGQVSHFRQDLADAGLGDGYLGFEIPIAGERAPDLASVVVRLDGSDAVLVQPQARVVGLGQEELLNPQQLQRDLAQYRFMLSQGWIEQTDYDFLKTVTRRGWHEQALPKGQRDGAAVEAGFASLAQRAMSVLHRREVRLDRQAVASSAELEALIERLPRADERPVIALHGAGFTLRLAEGSHVSDSTGAPQMGIDAVVGRHQLLLIDTRCERLELSFHGDDGLTVLSAFSPTES
jgi:hypothetical protein